MRREVSSIADAVSGMGGSNVAEAEAFRSVTARLAFDFIRPRTTFDVAADIGRQRYQFGANGLDRNEVDAGVAFTRRLRETLDFHVNGSYQRRTPLSALPADRTSSGSAGFDWRAGALLSLTLSYAHESRTTDAGGLAYAVNRTYLGFNYGPPAPRVVFTMPGQNATGVSSP